MEQSAMRPNRYFFILLTIGLIACAVQAWAAGLTVDGIRYGLNAGRTRVVVDLGGKADFRVFTLADPARLVIDLPAAQLRLPAAAPASDDTVRSYRSGTLDDGLTRIVFDLNRFAVVDKAFTLPPDDTSKNRIVVDLAPSSENVFRAGLEKVFGNADLKGTGTAPPPISSIARARNEAVAKASPVAVPAPKPGVSGKPQKYVIVVDAGHGGNDPGAIGASGVHEKDVTLSVARAVKRAMEETGRYRVVLTRDSDVYIPLRQRPAIARKAKADLFISIHADKIGRTNVRGASIYTLSRTASDVETARLAEEENKAGVVAGVDLDAESEDVAGILLDLAMREKMNESSLFARFLEEAFSSKNIKLLPNSHRSAGFAVLKAPDVPSVLIESGFLSNTSEAKLLSSADFQRRLADAIVDGVDAYFRKIEALKKI
jgi:N-acetylmuramoyl-L-alanine amidase